MVMGALPEEQCLRWVRGAYLKSRSLMRAASSSALDPLAMVPEMGHVSTRMPALVCSHLYGAGENGVCSR